MLCFCRHLSSSPFDKDLLCTCFGHIVDNKSRVECVVWRMGEEGVEPAPLQLVEQLKHSSNVRWSVVVEINKVVM